MSEKRSRVKKYATLRDQMINDTQSEIETKELSSFANQLHAIDSEQFNSMQVDNSSDYHSPLHKRNDYYSYSKPVEFTEPVADLPQEPEDYNNLMDSIVNEVKQYNVEKGYRKNDDTRSNLLFELKSKQNIIRPYGPNSISQKTLELDDEEELLETIDDSTLEPENVAPNLDDTQIFNVDDVQIKLQEKTDYTDINETISMKINEYMNNDSNNLYYDNDDNDLVQKTMELKSKIDEQSTIVDSIKSKVDRTNLVINTVLTVLVVAVVAILFVFIYMILKLNQVI